MSKHLMLGQHTPNWLLPVDTDVDELRNRLEAAMREGEIARVVVEMGDGPEGRTEILVNCKTLDWVAVHEVPEPRSIGF